MKTIIYILVVLVFCFIVVRRKIAPLFSKRKEKTEKQNSDTGKTIPALPDTTSATQSHAGYYTTGGIRTQYTVLVFDYSEAITPLEFSDIIESRLTNTLLKIADMGYPYTVEHLTLTTALVFLISYTVSQPL